MHISYLKFNDSKIYRYRVHSRLCRVQRHQTFLKRCLFNSIQAFLGLYGGTPKGVPVPYIRSVNPPYKPFLFSQVKKVNLKLIQGDLS